MGEVRMLTLLVGVRSTLADDLQAAAAEVFGKALTMAYVVSMESRACYTFLERACHDLSEWLRATLRSSRGNPPGAFHQNECANEFLFPAGIETRPATNHQADRLDPQKRRLWRLWGDDS